MKIRPLDNWKLLGTSVVMDVNRTYDADHATNQPDWEEKRSIFADVDGASFLLHGNEYALCDEYEVVVGNVGNVHHGWRKRIAIGVFRSWVENSKRGCSRAGGEPVTLFCNGEIMREYRPTIKWFTVREIKDLLVSLKKEIGPDYRYFEEGDTPSMCVTISTNDGSSWSYQTGDNSFTGACYWHRHWSVFGLDKKSNCMELARDAVNELKDMVAEAAV